MAYSDSDDSLFRRPERGEADSAGPDSQDISPASGGVIEAQETAADGLTADPAAEAADADSDGADAATADAAGAAASEPVRTDEVRHKSAADAVHQAFAGEYDAEPVRSVRKGSRQPIQDDPDDQTEGGKKSGVWQVIKDYGVSLIVAVLIAFLVNTFVLLNATIPSGSMETTIMTGDRVFGFRLAYLFSDPQRGDIVIFKYPDDPSTNFIKRIIGLPGETVTIRAGRVYINDSTEPLPEEYLAEAPAERDFGPYEVPEDCYFMLGDNRNNSRDSRFWNNTYVRRDQILAKAFLRYWKGFRLYTGTDYE